MTSAYLIIADNDFDKARFNGYKYLIRNNNQPFCAFRTDKGFERFCRLTQLNYTKVESGVFADYCYNLDKTFESRYFWALSEVPETAIKHKNHSNGSLVDCYVQVDNNHVIFYRPNCNSKPVYKPLTLQQHLYFISKVG